MKPALLLGSVVAIAACGAEDKPPLDPSALEPPPECAPAPAPTGWTYPAGPYGTTPGDTFEDFSGFATITDCQGNSANFGDVLANSELVLFNIGAGWCRPCIEETRTMDQDIFRRFCGRGLRVVQVLYEDEDNGRAGKFFCQQWKETYTLSFPVLVDPFFETEVHFQDSGSQTPLNMLIAPDGEILFRFVSTAPADLDQTIDGLLPP